MKKLILTSCLLTLLILIKAQEKDFPKLTGSYFGQKPPESAPELFAPNYISNGIDHCTPTFSPDGKEIYFEILDKKNTAKIGYTKLVNEVWNKPDTVSFCKNDSFIYGNPFISPDGKRMFFTSFRPGAVSENKENIWYSERTSAGWADPKPVSSAVNDLRIHWSISISKSGTLYFQGTETDKNKESGIYYSKLVNGEYAYPVRMCVEINEGKNETCPYIAPDESYIIFNRFDMVNPTNSGIFISFRDKSGSWLPAIMVLGGSPDKGGMSPKITPDGKYIFYANRGIYWMPFARIIEKLRPGN